MQKLQVGDVVTATITVRAVVVEISRDDRTYEPECVKVRIDEPKSYLPWVMAHLVAKVEASGT